MQKLRIGMVGAGFIADWHRNAFITLPEVEFAGMCRNDSGADGAQAAANQSALEKKCHEWNIPAYPSFEAMANDPSLDALIIGSINPFHHAQILAGLKAGKHLLVEKPVVTDFAQVDEIKALSAASGKVVFPGHNFVYRGTVQKAKQILASESSVVLSPPRLSPVTPLARPTQPLAREEGALQGRRIDG